MLSSVCKTLQESGFNVAGMLVSYFAHEEEMYIYAGKDPIPPEKDGVSISNLKKNRLMLKFRLPEENSSKDAPEPTQVPTVSPLPSK